MTKPLSERELLKLQIQTYDFYASLIDRAVVAGAHQVKMPRWDESRALEYRGVADQLRQRLAQLEAEEPEVLDAPAVSPIPLAEVAPAETSPTDVTTTDARPASADDAPVVAS